MIRFDYRAVQSLEETFSLLAEFGEEAKLMSGGTALVLLMKQRLVHPAVVADLRHLASGLAGVREVNGALSIGALTTHRDVETSPLVTRSFPVLADTLRKVATIRIRNVGTLGGNLAHADPNQDPPVTLIALGASVVLSSANGQREVPLDEFFTDYYETVLKRESEVLTEIKVPQMHPRAAGAFFKFLPRSADDYACVAVTAVLTPDASGTTCQEVRIALGSAGSTTIRAREAENAVRGQPLTIQTFRQAGAAAKTECDPISDIRGSAEYKRDMVEVFVRRALQKALEEATTRSGGDGRA